MTEAVYFIARDDLARAFENPRAVRSFEMLQQQVKTTEVDTAVAIETTNALKDAAFVVLSANAELPNERVLSFGSGLSAVITPTTIAVDVAANVARDADIAALLAGSTFTGPVQATEFRVGGAKVVGARQGAIADDASGAVNQTTVNAILAALRAHGLIAP